MSFKRKIFYLSGYDPRGARFYHQLYGEQAGIYAANTGKDISVSKREQDDAGNASWTVSNGSDQVETQFVALGWNDVIRATWDKNPLRLFWGAIASTLSFSWGWEWRKFARHIPMGTFIAFYYPALSVVILPAILITLIWLVAGPLIAVILGAGISYFAARYIQSLWLLRFVIFNDRYARGEDIPYLLDRLASMAATIEQALSEDWDEVLIVTHSNGSILAMPIMQQLLAKRGGKMPANFALMTLGSCIPLVGIRGDAKAFRAVLEDVAKGDFLWLDLGSLTDGACIPLVDPCVTCATDHRPDMHVLSPRWFKYCDPATYRQRRRNKYEVHFEYLRTFDRISPLDYLRVTSCGEPLSASIAAFENAKD